MVHPLVKFTVARHGSTWFVFHLLSNMLGNLPGNLTDNMLGAP
jgi:hypothetical protein